MDGELPLLTMLRSRLGYLNERQKLIAQNVANGNSKGFVPSDLTPFSFQSKVNAVGVTPMVTQPAHLLPSGARSSSAVAGAFKTRKAPDSETTLDGNSVVLEEEMLKMSDSRMNYDAAITFYQKSLSLMRMAARPPGR